MASSNIGVEILTTIADELREEGREQGMQQGMQQGIKMGMQQGIIQTAREALIDILEARFDVVAESMIKTINEINDPAILRILLRKAVKAASFDEFTQIAQLILK